jgi:cysteine desulfurase/selenocysteine lyase
MPVAEGGASMAEHASFDGFTPKQLPFKHEAGEPAFGEVVAWGTSLEYWDRTGLDRITAYEKELTAHAAQRLASVRGVRVLGSPAERLAIVTFVVDGKEPSEVEKALDAEGIAVRAGNLDAEPLLEALGARQAVRASFLFYNTRAEADALADAVERIAGA